MEDIDGGYVTAAMILVKNYKVILLTNDWET